jgi:hypothetical protein
MGHQGADRRHAFLDDQRVAEVKEDSQTKDATTMRGDAAIAEIEAEQVNVLRRQLAESVHGLTTRSARRLCCRLQARMLRNLACEPIPHGRDGQVGTFGDSPRAQASLAKR